MARNHTFPLCSPRFNALDFDTIDESEDYDPRDGFATYGGVSSTGVKFSASVILSNSDVQTATFAIQEGGEYLVDSDISAPSETTLDWTGDANGIQINAYSLNSLKYPEDAGVFFPPLVAATEMSEELNTGEIICIGSKPPSDSNFVRNVLPGVFAGISGGKFLMPFTDDILTSGNFTIRQADPELSYNSAASWVTLMWSGTRWVFFGSNNWV